MRFLFLTILIFTAQSAFSQSKFSRQESIYVGAGYADMDFSIEGIDLGGITSGMILGGYKRDGLIAGQARITMGDPDEFGGTTAYTGSLYWRPEASNETAKSYLLIGYTAASVRDDDDSYSRSGISYGGGIGFVLSEEWNLNFEYIKVLNNSELELDAITANVDYKLPF